jgi:hypothetical protein
MWTDKQIKLLIKEKKKIIINIIVLLGTGG